MSTEDKYSVTFSHPSLGRYSAHAIASDGFNDYNEGLSLLMDCEVGGAVDDDAASEAFREFANDYLTDGNGYAPASTYEACSKEFTAAWPDRVAATAAARAELKRLHGDDRTVGARRAEALNRADARDDAEDDAPPAQAVDLGQFRDCVEVWFSKHLSDYEDGQHGDEFLSSIEDRRHELLALIDGQGKNQ